MIKGVKGKITFASNGRTVVEQSFTKAKIKVTNPATVLEENNVQALAEMKHCGKTLHY
jgi:hypothetical protein